MKKLLVILIVCIAASNLFAQGTNILANQYFRNSYIDTCDFDSTKIIHQMPQWNVYQTLNDEWDGPLDSSNCISLKTNGAVPNTRGGIYLSEIDTSKILFITPVLDSLNPIQLSPNSVFNLFFSSYLNRPGLLDTSTCNGFNCSYAIVEIDIPDSNNTGRTLRTYRSPISTYSFSLSIGEAFCVPSERFDTQYLHSFVIALKFKNVIPSDSLSIVECSFSDMQDTWGPTPFHITSVHAQYSWNSTDDYVNLTYNPQSIGQGGTALIHYIDSTYPAPNHMSYVPVYPVDTLADFIKNINVEIDYNSTIVYQPFAQLRGSMVNLPPDSPVVYHQVTLINNGGSICVAPFIDVIVQPGDNIYHKSGHIEFGGDKSCMQFMPDAKLIVGENATLNYGDDFHRGMMLLRENSEIVMMKNSTLNFYGKMILMEYDYIKEGEFYMTLPPGTSLNFMKGSHITNQWSVNKKMMLNVYMKGGTIDDSGLSYEERKLINRIYDEEDLQENLLSIYPNPSNGIVTFQITYPFESIAEIQFTDLIGKVVYETSIELRKGINESQINYGALPSGRYHVNVKTNKAFSKKIMVLN